jgi:mannose/fructose/N-acetylgalactosamine-specific phosphotransferase system component IID
MSYPLIKFGDTVAKMIGLLIIGVLVAFGIYTGGTVLMGQQTVEREKSIQTEILGGLMPITVIAVIGIIIIIWMWKR